MSRTFNHIVRHSCYIIALTTLKLVTATDTLDIEIEVECVLNNCNRKKGKKSPQNSLQSLRAQLQGFLVEPNLTPMMDIRGSSKTI